MMGFHSFLFENKIKALEGSRLQIWKSARLVTDGMATGADGLHLSPPVLKHHSQVKIKFSPTIVSN